LQFQQQYGFSPNGNEVLRFSDELRMVYCQIYHHGEDEVDLAMHDHYFGCCQLIDETKNANSIRGGAGTAVDDNGELDGLDADNVEEIHLPTNRDEQLHRRNQQQQQPNVRHCGDGDGDGDGDGSGGSSSDGAYGGSSSLQSLS